MAVTNGKPAAGSKSLAAISDAKKHVEQAEREISQGRTTFEVERKRFKEAKRKCEVKGAQAEARQWSIAAELLKKKEAELKDRTKQRGDGG
jgi:hypothetical protein